MIKGFGQWRLGLSNPSAAAEPKFWKAIEKANAALKLFTQKILWKGQGG